MVAPDRPSASFPAFEILEPRMLLNGDTAALRSLYDGGASSGSPSWFENLVETHAPLQQGTPNSTRECRIHHA